MSISRWVFEWFLVLAITAFALLYWRILGKYGFAVIWILIGVGMVQRVHRTGIRTRPFDSILLVLGFVCLCAYLLTGSGPFIAVVSGAGLAIQLRSWIETTRKRRLFRKSEKPE